MKKVWLLLITIDIFSMLSWSQTDVFVDYFNTSQGVTYTTSGPIGTSSWTITRSGDDWGGKINPNLLDLTNNASGTVNEHGWVFASTLTSSFLSPYNTSLNLNDGIITWSFNMRQIRTDPAGFTGLSYGVAFILAGSSQFADYEGNGYAIVLGQSGPTDPIRLVRYSEGLSSSLTNVITSNTPGLTDFGDEYLSIKVTYNPSSDLWELFLRNDGLSSFTDPTTGTLTSQGTATGNYYIGLPHLYMGSYWHGSTASDQTAFFDNVSVVIGSSITAPIISLSNSYLSGFTYPQGSGPSSQQLFNILGRNLTDNISLVPPADYEISTSSGGSFSPTNPITLVQFGGNVTSTPIYVRLKSGLSTGTYDNENITATSNGAFNKTVTCNGVVTTTLPPSLPLVEEFNYSGGEILTDHGWNAHSAQGVDPITVNNYGLTYANYPSSGIGNSANIVGSGEDVNLGFLEQNLNGSTIYFSVLVNVTEVQNDLDGGYFLHLGDRLSATSFSFFSARVFVRVDASSNVNFGLSNTSTAQWIATNYTKNTTYLLVVKYTINTSGNDEAKMWILSSGVPLNETSAGTANITVSNTGQDIIDAIGIRQSVDIPDLVIDGIRVATSWSNAPLPVELSSFTAKVLQSGGVQLDWRTETEVDNYGFEIQHAQINSNFEFRISNFETIGFVKGSGNSNSPKDYSFIDDLTLTPDLTHTLRYRLKQLDTDGRFEYSKVIEVELGSPGKFELSQNYPNPFNPVTTIRYTLPKSGNVKLNVYNLLGEQVAKLVNGFIEAGVHTINFNALELNSGLYIYKIEAAGFVQSRKMVLIK